MKTFTIRRLGHHGDGIADGPIYAHLTLPGEVISGELKGDRIDVPKIVTPSTNRIRPLCAHYKRCGGCSLQHADESFVAEWKVSFVKEALAAHGLASPIRKLHTSPARSRRRATFTGRRSKSGALIGFHIRGSDVVIEVPECQLILPELLSIRPALGELTELGASRKGAISIAATWSEEGADVTISNAKPLDQSMLNLAVEVASQSNIARLTWNDETISTYALPVQRFAGIAVIPPPNAFMQATEHGEMALRHSVSDAVSGAKHVIDLFSGCGTFSLPLAKDASVHSVEADSAMLSALDQGWRKADNLHLVTTESRDLFRRPLVPLELNKYNAAVIDPPRAGAEAQVREVAGSQLECVAMVSCNPVTFARDAKTLIDAGYELNWIDVVDQFRWSPHIELAASFTK